MWRSCPIITFYDSVSLLTSMCTFCINKRTWLTGHGRDKPSRSRKTTFSSTCGGYTVKQCEAALYTDTCKNPRQSQHLVIFTASQPHQRSITVRQEDLSYLFKTSGFIYHCYNYVDVQHLFLTNTTNVIVASDNRHYINQELLKTR